MRTRKQTVFRAPEEASSSGRYHVQESVEPFGTLIPHNKFEGAFQGSGLPEGKYPTMGVLEDLFLKVNNRFLPIVKSFNAVTKEGIIYGAILDGHIRPLYDQHGRNIVISQSTLRKVVIDEHEAARLGFHQHISQHIGNRALVAPPSSPKQ